VAQVLDSKFDKCKKDPLLYYVQWSGYENMADEYSWLTADGDQRELITKTRVITNENIKDL